MSINRRIFLNASVAGLMAPSLSTASMPGRIKVGQIGTTHAHADGKMATFRKYPDRFEIVGVTESDASRRRHLASGPTYSGLSWMSEDELLEVPGLQAVAVETNIEHLLPAAEKCVLAGKHVHLDKPAGVSLPHFKRVCDIADSRKLALQMGYMFRGNPAFRYLFAAVRKGWLGEIFQVHCEMSKKIGAAARKPLARYKGGAMFELGCHLIDAVVTVLGPPDHVSTFHRQTRPNLDNLFDNCLAVFEYPSATATIRSSLTEVAGGRRRQFTVCGTNGTIEIRPLEPCHLTLTLEADVDGMRRGTHEIQLPDAAGRYDGDLLHFARVIRGEEQEEYDRSHDLTVQEAVLRAGNMSV